MSLLLSEDALTTGSGIETVLTICAGPESTSPSGFSLVSYRLRSATCSRLLMTQYWMRISYPSIHTPDWVFERYEPVQRG